MRAGEFRSSTAHGDGCCRDFDRHAAALGEGAVDRHALLGWLMHDRLHADGTLGITPRAATRFLLDTASGAPAASRAKAAAHQASARPREARLPEED